MGFLDYLVENSGRIGFLFVQHVQVVVIAVALATLVSLSVVIGTERSPRLRAGVLAVSGTILTIPSFALFGLLIPVLGLGAAPTIFALTVYATFPIMRNAVTGLETVDGAVVDAARGMGMGAARRLWVVRFPLAWPVMLNGIRVATIMVVAIAAIGAAVQGPGLGKLIFRGLSRIGGANALNEVLSGVLAIVAVALLLDALFLLIGKLTIPRGLHV